MPAPTQSTSLFFSIPLLSLLLLLRSRSMHCSFVPPLSLLALLAAVLGLVPSAVYAQEVVHALLCAATGSAIMHLLVLKSKLYASLVLPATLLSCATLLALMTPFLPSLSHSAHVAPILILIFTLSTLPHSVFFLLHVTPIPHPPLPLPLSLPLPSPTSSASSFPSSHSHENQYIKGTFADYKSSILPPPRALQLRQQNPTSSWFSQSDADVESLSDCRPNSQSVSVLLQTPTLVLAAQLCSILASAFEIPAVVLLYEAPRGGDSSAALASAFWILQAVFTVLCLVLILFAYHRCCVDTVPEPDGIEGPKPTSTPPPTPASSLNSESGSHHINPNRRKPRETPNNLTPLIIPLPTSKSTTTPFHAYTHHDTRFPHLSYPSLTSSPRAPLPMGVCTASSCGENKLGLRKPGMPVPLPLPGKQAAGAEAGRCMRPGVATPSDTRVPGSIPVSSLDRPFTYTHPRPHANANQRRATTPTRIVRPRISPLIIPNGPYRTSTPTRPSALRALSHAHSLPFPLSNINRDRDIGRARVRKSDSDVSISSPTPTNTPTRTSIELEPGNQAHDAEEHDCTDLRDPFATRSPPRSAPCHYVSRSSVSSGGSASESGSTVCPTRMSAWGRLQFPVRLPLHGTNVGVGASVNAAPNIGLGLGLGLGVVPGANTMRENRSGSRGRARSNKRLEKRAGRKDKEETDVDVDMDDMQDSALLAQRLLRRLQGYGHGAVGSGSWVGGKYPASVGSAV